MKKIYTSGFAISCLVFITLLSPLNNLKAQCTNADFSNGNFSGGWSGTYSNHVCTGVYLLGICAGCGATDPLNTAGFNQGPNNTAPSNATTEYSHIITTTAGGNDPYLTTQGATLPMVWPGGGSTNSCRIGNMWQAIGGDGTGDGETLSYTFTVTPNNCNFTYHYACLINAGSGHSNTEQPFFNIKMLDGTGAEITCAAYDVNANTAASIGGFSIINDASYGNVYWKPWTSVFIPLNNYMGQTVKITFTSRGCLPSGCAGSHWAYEYISAECAPLTLVASTPTVCGGTTLTLTAPQGAATYSWTGPGIVSGANQQIVTINQPGRYVVQMTTFGNSPCTFSLDTIMAGNPANPQASFSAPTVCVGSSMQFTDASSPHASLTAWSWNFGDGSALGTTENPTHVYTTAGTYPVTLTVTSTPCTKDTIINVTVSPPPTSDFTATSPVCEGTNSTVTYTGNGLAGDTYTWNFNGGTATPGTGQGPQAVSWSTGGTKTITLTVSAGSCSSPVTSQQVVVNPFPGMTITPYTPICSGSNATLTASGATTYSWAADPSITGATNTGSITVNPVSTTTYTVTGSSTNCTAVDTVTVGVYPIPTSTFTVVSPVCVGQNSTVTYTGNAGAAATYTWNFSGGTSTPAGQVQGPYQVNWSTAGTPNVSLTVSQYGCTSTPTTLPVTVNPNPTSTFTTTSPLCLGTNSTVTFTGTATGTAVYTWGFNGGTVVSGAAAGPYSINWASAGNYNVTLSVTDNGCNSPLTTVPVTIYPIPTATFTAVSPICSNVSSTVTYTGTATVNATYAWNFGGGSQVPNTQAQGPYQVSWNAAGSYNITLNVTEHGCVAPPVTVPVTVNPVPTSTFTAPGPLCVGNDTTVTYTGTGDNLATYTWNFAGGNAQPGAGQGPHTVSWATAGTKNITLTVSENGCTSNPTTVPVIVNAIPTSTFTAVSPICSNVSSTVTYTGSASPSATYAWNFNGGNSVPAASGQGPYQVSWATAGVYNIVLNVTENNCSATPVTVPVTVNAIPVSDAGQPVTYCNGLSGVIGNAATAGYTYLWVPAAGLSDATSANPTVTLTTAPDNITVQNYTVTTTSLGCTSTASVVVTVNPVPAPILTPPGPQCLTGNSFTFKSQGTFLNSASIAWTFGADATPATSTNTTQNVSYSTAGTRAVSYTVTQAGGCSASLTDSVTVYSMPQPLFKPDTLKGCENFEVCFHDSSSGVGPMLYTWNFGDGESSSAPSPCHLYVAPGIYSVYLKVVSSQQCSSDITVPNLIQVIADPIAKFTPTVSVIQQPESLIGFNNQSLNSVSYLWNFNSAGVSDANIGNSTDVNPQFNFTQYGLYTVKLTAYNELRCADSTQLPITVLPPQDFFIPNAFTPNGDGNNDEFFIYLQEGATLFSFKVFDRWGEKVHDGLYPWDGNYKGKKAPASVYVYEANIHLIDLHIDILRKGSVTLIR